MTYRPGLHRFALFTAVSTFFLIVAGGLVTSTGSGLSVPDWPNTYGHFMFAYPLDGMVGGIFYEHSHRMIASVVGFLTMILTIWIWRRDERRTVRLMAAAALAAVIVQGVLGGITVLYLLPTAVSVAHATLAQTFFTLTVAISLFTSRWWIERSDAAGPAAPVAGSPVRLAAAAAGMVWIQLVLGAVMRHTGAGLAVPDFPLAYGQIIPSFSTESLGRYNNLLLDSDVRIAADGAITSSQIAIHLMHRYWGLITGIVLLWSAHRFFWGSPRGSRQRRLGALLALVTMSQVTLGAFTVLSGKTVEIATAHVALGALLLALCALSVLYCYREAAPAGLTGGLRVREVTA